MSATLRAVSVSLVLLAAVAHGSESDPFREPNALSDGTPHERPKMTSGFLGLPFSYGFAGFFPVGVSGRFTLPILADGFLFQVNDELDVDLGVDFAFFGGAGKPFFWLGVPVEAMWQFHFVERFAGYVKVGAVLGVVSDGAPGSTGFGSAFFASVIGAVGLNFKLTQALYLRFEVGYPWAKLGLGVAF